MIDPGKALWVAEQHGHTIAVMLKDYARWTTRRTDKDAEVAAICAAMNATPYSLRKAA